MKGNAMPDLFDARQARDAALEQVTENVGKQWMTQGLEAVRALAPFEGTGEDIRLAILSRGLPHPHHHNAWGALTREAIKKGVAVRSGWGQMKTKKSHARMTAIYKIGVA